jgi:hypothetical protein
MSTSGDTGGLQLSLATRGIDAGSRSYSQPSITDARSQVCYMELTKSRCLLQAGYKESRLSVTVVHRRGLHHIAWSFLSIVRALCNRSRRKLLG